MQVNKHLIGTESGPCFYEKVKVYCDMVYAKGMRGVAYLNGVQTRDISVKCFLIWQCLHKQNYSIGQSKFHYFYILDIDINP